MLLNKKIRKYIIPPVLVLLFLLSVLALANSLIQTDRVQQYLIGNIFKDSGININTGIIEINLLGPFGLSIEDFSALLDKNRGSITARRVDLTFSKRNLLKGKFYPKKIRIVAPVIKIDARDNLDDFVKTRHGEKKFFFYGNGIEVLQIRNGQVIFKSNSTAALDDLSLELWRINDESEVLGLTCSGVIDYKNNYSFFKSNGEINIDPAEILNSDINIDLETINTPAIWTPWSKYIEMRSGSYDSILKVKGTPGGQLTAKGSLSFKGLNFILTKKGRSQEYSISELDCTLDTRLKDRTILVDSLNMKTRDASLDLNVILKINTPESPHLKLTIRSGFMPVDTFRKYYPFPTTKPWVKDTLLPLFESGDIKINALVLDGNFDQIHNLKDSKNYSVIGMSFSGNNLKLSNHGLQIPFNDVSTRVDIKNGDLIIPELRGRFGSSIIENASFHGKDILSGLSYFNVFVDGDFDIDELISIKEMGLITSSVRERINDYQGSSGRLKAKTTIGYKKDWDVPRILSGDYHFTDFFYNHDFLSMPLSFKSLNFHIYEQDNNTFSADGLLGNMPFSSSGLFEIRESSLELLKAQTTALLDMDLVLAGVFKNNKYPFRFTERLPWEISMEQQKNVVIYSGKVDIRNLSIESEGLFIDRTGLGGELIFDLTSEPDGKVDLNRAQFVFDNSQMTLSGGYNTLTKRPEILKMETESLVLSDLGLHFKNESKLLSGNLSGSINIDFTDNDIHNPHISGQIKGANLSYNSELLPLPLSSFDFRLDLAGEKGLIDDCRFKIGESIVNLKGTLHGWKHIQGDFMLTSDFFDLTDFIASKSRPPEKEVFAPLFQPELNLKLNASRGIWRKLDFSHLNADLVLSGDRITINNAQADLEKGDLSLRGYIVKGDSPKIDVSGDINLKEQPIDKLISDTGFGDKGIKGTASANASLRLNRNAEEPFLKGLSGNLNNVSITKGLHKNSRVFIKILDILNIPDKFKKRPPGMREEGFYFESIQGDAVIEKGILKTDNFVMKSPAFNAVGSGEENLYEMTHDFRLLVQPLGNIDFIISQIPLVGRIFVDDNETFFTVGYDIRGSWSKPSLVIAPVENIKGLFGVLKRALLTPVRLLDNLNNATKRKQKTEPEDIKP